MNNHSQNLPEDSEKLLAVLVHHIGYFTVFWSGVDFGCNNHHLDFLLSEHSGVELHRWR